MKGGGLVDQEAFVRAVEEAKRNGTYNEEIQLVTSGSKIGAIFESFDLDKDGFIGKEELRVCLAVAGQPVREETLNAMIALITKSGRISKNDFCQFFSSKSSQVDEQESFIVSPVVDKSVAPVVMNLEQISETELLQMDSTARRKKTSEIVLALLGSVDSIRSKDIKQLYRRFTQLDTRKAGKLNMLQFSKIFDGYPFLGPRKVRMNYVNLLFVFCDADKSNYIDAKEFMTGLCWLGNFGNIDKLRFTFMLFDESGDGVLDRKEMTTLIASINIGSLASRDELTRKIDQIFHQLAKSTLTFEDLIQVADNNPDLFTSIN